MLRIEMILVPVDFSKQGAVAAQHAAALARHFNARITLLHVNPVFVPATAEFAGPVDIGWVTALEMACRRQLSAYGSDEFRGLEIQRVVVTGDPAAKIVEHANRDRTDLIVMPTHGYGPFRRFLIGSVAAKVLHDAECPVWTAAHLPVAAPHSGAVANVVCAIDNSPASETVLQWASSFAAEFGARLTAVHAVPTVEVPEGFLDPEVRRNRLAAAESTVRCFQTKTGARGSIEVCEGEPSKVVAAVAARSNADVIVIGRSPAEEGRLRRHAYSIIRESPCPVISV